MVETKIVAVGAHPDDIEFLFGGTLALLKEKHGDDVDLRMYTICNGNMGSAELAAEDLRATRWEESLDAAALIGARFDTLDIEDLRADENRYLASDILVGQFRRIRPDIVLTHSPRDMYMPDHRVASWIVSDALFCAMLPNYRPSQGHEDIRTCREKQTAYVMERRFGDPLHRSGYHYVREGIMPLPALYYGDPFPGHDIFGVEQVPTFVVDVSSTIERKVEMLKQHVSQGVWLAEGHGDSDYILTARRWCEAKGALVGMSSGEAFVTHRGTPYSQEPRLEQLLPGYVHNYSPTKEG